LTSFLQFTILMFLGMQNSFVCSFRHHVVSQFSFSDAASVEVSAFLIHI